MTNLGGFHAALPTPFTADGALIDEAAFARLVRHNIDGGLSGLYVGGSTGETFLMSLDERARAFEIVAEAAAGDCVLIGQVGDLNPAVSHALARKAESLGYDAVSAVPPFYYGYRFDEVRTHYATLASTTDLPFLVYNIPALAGVTLSTDQLLDLMSLPKVVGIKNTSSDYYGFEQLRRRAPDKVLLNGFDETLLPGLGLGADGGIGSTFNLYPETIVEMGRAVAAGDIETARSIQNRMNAFIDVIVAHRVFPALKYLLGLRGIPVGECRAPFLPVSPEGKRELEAAADAFFGTAATPAAASG